MNILYFSTSSDGNCSVIESKDGHLLVIDAGIKYRIVDKSIGYRLHKADALLITHSHKDHTGYIREFECIKEIYLPYEYAEHITYWNLLKGNKITNYLESGNIITDGFIVSPIEMVHANSDSTSCECYGFLILDKSTGEKMLWATDTQFIKQRFSALDYYCIESNYFETDFSNEDMDSIVKSVEARRLQSHMSFETAVKFMKQQDLSKCKEIRLLHISNSLSNKRKAEMARRMKKEIGRSDIKVVY